MPWYWVMIRISEEAIFLELNCSFYSLGWQNTTVLQIGPKQKPILFNSIIQCQGVLYTKPNLLIASNKVKVLQIRSN